MADTKISADPAATTLTGTELLAGVQSGTNVKITANQLKTLIFTGLVIGTTAITSGSAGRLLYEDATNKVGEISGWSSDGANALTGGVGTTLVVGNATLGGNAAAIGGNVSIVGSLNATGSAIISGAIRGAANNSTFTLGASSDVVISRLTSASLQFGSADAAAPIAQTIGFQSVVTGTSNTAGAVGTIRPSVGTGTQNSGAINVLQARGGSSGSTPNATTTGLTLVGASSLLAFAAGTTTQAQMNFASSTAPSSPANGDFWFDGTNFKAQVAGTTKTFTIV